MLFNGQWHFQWLRRILNVSPIVYQGMLGALEKSIGKDAIDPVESVMAANRWALTQPSFQLIHSDNKLEALKIFARVAKDAVHVAAFNCHGAKTIRLTESAISAFKFTDIDLPVSSVKPPFVSQYIAFPANSFSVKRGDTVISIEGVYVSQEKVLKTGNTALAMLVVGRDEKKSSNTMECYFGSNSALPVSGNENTPFDVAIDALIDSATLSDASYHSEFKQLFKIVGNTLLFMSSPERNGVIRTDSPHVKLETEENPHKRQKLEAKILLNITPDEYVLGQHITICKPEDANLPSRSGEASGVEMCKHWRRGHWHNVWVGKRLAPETRMLVPRWFKPVLVNAKKEGPIPGSATYYLKPATV